MDEILLIRKLYEQLINFWNIRSGDKFAGLFTNDADLIGFDGSQSKGATEINTHLNMVFEKHKTLPFVYIIKDVRLIGENAALLNAVAGMIPEGETDVNPALNTIQTMMAVKQDGIWKIALFQNTPAAWHGRPDDVAKLAKELTDVYSKKQ